MFGYKCHNETIVGGATILLFTIISSIYKFKHLLRRQKHYNKKAFLNLIHSDIASQFLDLKYELQFNDISEKKKRALEITCIELCDQYKSYIDLMIVKIECNSKMTEEFCRYKYHSKLIFTIMENINKQILNSVPYEYYLKFKDILDEFTQPFTSGLLEELQRLIEKFHNNQGHNYSRLLLQILELHFIFSKLFLKFLKVNCKLLNGSLD